MDWDEVDWEQVEPAAWALALEQLRERRLRALVAGLVGADGAHRRLVRAAISLAEGDGDLPPALHRALLGALDAPDGTLSDPAALGAALYSRGVGGMEAALLICGAGLLPRFAQELPRRPLELASLWWAAQGWSLRDAIAGMQRAGVVDRALTRDELAQLRNRHGVEPHAAALLPYALETLGIGLSVQLECGEPRYDALARRAAACCRGQLALHDAGQQLRPGRERYEAWIVTAAGRRYDYTPEWQGDHIQPEATLEVLNAALADAGAAGRLSSFGLGDVACFAFASDAHREALAHTFGVLIGWPGPAAEDIEALHSRLRG